MIGIANKLGIGFTLIMIVLSFQGISQSDLPTDSNATKETVNLYHNLKKIASTGFLMGQQDATAYGVGWNNKKNKSDIKEVTGEFPALYGWDLSYLEKNSKKDIDGVRFRLERKLVKQAYKRGGVNTFSWHCSSPFGAPKGAWDTTSGTVASILPGGVNHEKYKQWLDKVAVFFLSLKGENKELIPVLFRPFHELSGNWFWWGRSACTPGEFKAIFQFVVHYLRDEKKVHNLLYVYNTGTEFNNSSEYLERYPGDEVVDVVSFDNYQSGGAENSNNFITKTSNNLAILENIAKEKNKIAALAEIGYENIPLADWWTKTLYSAVSNHHISYILLWRNAGYDKKTKKISCYAPYKGQVSEEDFRKFYKLNEPYFEKRAADAKLYQ